MSEDEARETVRQLVSRETFARIERYVGGLRTSSTMQNLVSMATIDAVWSRHVLDSAQLGRIASGRIVDIGSGAGFPGIILALMGLPVTLVEPRRLRAAFLKDVAQNLGLPEHSVLQLPANALDSSYDTITARAVAPLDRLFAMTAHLATQTSRWVLPKGRTVQAELEVAKRAWHGRFELVQSITDPSAMIVVAEQLRRRTKQ